MKPIPFKNDLPIEWTVKRNGVAEVFTGKTIKVFAVNELGKATAIGGVTISGNTVSGTFYAKDQHYPGVYCIRLEEFVNGVRVSTLESHGAFELVTHSIGDDDELLVDIASDFRVPSNGATGATGATGAQGPKGDDGLTTSVKVNGVTHTQVNGLIDLGTISGGGGTSDYSDLSNKPQIGGVTLSGNKSAADLGLATASHNHDGVYLTEETEPAFNASVAKTLEESDIAYWNAKADSTDIPTDFYTKSEADSRFQVSGDYAMAGASYTKGESDGRYITEESDPIFMDSAAYGIMSTDIEGWNNKVDKVVGKGLSTNDYTNTDKAVVAQIPSDLVDSTKGTEGQVLTRTASGSAEWKDAQGGGADPNKEEVIVSVKSNVGEATIVDGKSVSVTVDGVVTSYTFDSLGNVIFYVDKTKQYTITFPTISGYQAIASKTYTAENYVRNVNIIAVKNWDSIAEVSRGFTVEASSNPDISASLDGQESVINRILSHGTFVIDEANKKYAKLSATDHNYFADGTPYTGNYGNCFRYLPKIWIAQSQVVEKHYYVSDQEISDVSLPESWIGTYKGSLVNATLVSRPNLSTTQNRTMSQFWTDAQQNGSNYGLVNYFDHVKLNALHLAKFGNMNSETTMGMGLQNAGADYYIHVTGKTATLGDGTGEKPYNGSYNMNKLFGIEGLAGATWEFRPNIRFDSSRAYIYEGNIVSNTASATRSFSCNRNSSGSYTTGMALGQYFDMIPISVSGSSVTYWCDGCWASSSGQLLCVGGLSNSGSLAGLSCAYSSTAFSVSVATIGARLAFKGDISGYQQVSGSELAALN